MQLLLLLLSAILVVIAPITYIASIIKGKTKPHRLTRFILALVLTLNFSSILALHANTGAVLFAAVLFAQGIIILLLSLWRGMGGTSFFDWVCFLIAILGIVGWQLTGNPTIGIVCSIVADFFAYLPAFVKTWKYPGTESHWFYTCGAIGALLSLAAYRIQFASLFQIYIVLSSLVMIVFIYRKLIFRT